MKKLLAIAICSLPLALAPTVYAQSNTTSDNAAAGGASGSSDQSGSSMKTPSANSAADASTTGTADSTATIDAKDAWSAKHDVIGSAVYNEKDENVGDINDVLLTPDGKVAYFVVGVGGFLGIGEHSVALPYNAITKSDDKMTLEGYTKDQLKGMPGYEPKPKQPAAPAGGAGGTLGAPAAPGAAGTPGAGAPGGATQ